MDLRILRGGRPVSGADLRKRAAKATVPELSKVMAVAETAFDMYLRETTDTLVRKHGSKYRPGSSSNLMRRTGEGLKQLQDWVLRRMGNNVVEGRLKISRYMATHEFGGTLRATSGEYMTVPLPAALNGDGTPRKPSARSWKGAFVAKSGNGNLVIVKRTGRKLVPLYVLRKSVKIRPRLGLRAELKKRRPGMHRDVIQRIREIAKSELK